MNAWVEIAEGTVGEIKAANGTYHPFEWGDDMLTKATSLDEHYVYVLSDGVRFRINEVSFKA